MKYHHSRMYTVIREFFLSWDRVGGRLLEWGAYQMFLALVGGRGANLKGCVYLKLGANLNINGTILQNHFV